mmetsp:Transcript_6888/g.17142  ORF Transcript_6888/g.17142 Transcript_6888/m.17142 type:complete len:233 (-) Transcript_6888:928-1626(-)
MHGVLTQDGAVDGVARVGGGGAHHVRGVDVLDVAAHLRFEALAEPRADVAQHWVTAGVRAPGAHDILLPRALGQYHHRIPLRRNQVLYVRHRAVGALHSEVYLRNEAHVGVSVGQRSVHGNEARLPAHKLHHPDAVQRRPRLGCRRLDRLLCLLYGGVEAKGLVDVQDVVIDGFRNSNHTHLQASLGALLADGIGARMRSIPTDDENHVHALPFDGVYDLVHVAPSAPAPHD